MNKTYRVKINQANDKGELVEVPVARPEGGPVRLKVLGGARYQLVDPDTGLGPENIRVDRKGGDLRVYFEGRSVPDLVLEDYYEAMAPGFNALIGEAENGRFYEYIPESAAGAASVPALTEEMAFSSLALGAMEVSPAGAAVGTLVAAGFPWLGLAGAGAAVAAASVGGGGGGSNGNGAASPPADNTPPVVQSARLLPDDDSGPKDNVTNDNTPRITGQTEANADVVVTINGKNYTGKADANGVFVIPVTDTLPDGPYTPQITVSDAAGNTSGAFAGTSFRVDTSATHNGADPDSNANAVPEILEISDDTGVSASDFYTRDNSLVFKGAVTGFVDNGAQVALVLRDSAGQTVDSGYARPQRVNGVWQWAWDRTSGTALADGRYTLEASLVDGAGNALLPTAGQTSTDTQVLVIDTDKAGNFSMAGSPQKLVDPNANSTIALRAITLDTGYSDKDFITSDRTLKFSGTLKDLADAQVWVQTTLRDVRGAVVATEFIKPVKAGSDTPWTWDLSERSLPDGQYSLAFAMIDKAGNALSSGSQAVVIDNASAINGLSADPNAVLTLGAIVLSEDTGLPGDLVTRDRTLSFTGSLDKPFTDNGDRLLVQVAGQDGKVVSQQYLTPSGNTWSFDNLTEFGVPAGARQYTVSATLVDAAGNVLKATDQTFLIDTIASITEKSAVDKGSMAWTYSVVNFSASERGVYAFTVDGQLYSREYTGGVFDMKEVLGKTFAPGQFTVNFTDASGNVSQLTNPSVSWDFGKAVMGSPDASMPVVLPQINFSGNSAVGSIGKLVLESAGGELDISGLYTSAPAVGDVTAVNHIDARPGDHVIKLTMGDVLALGVKDSFSVAAVHKGHLQLRIDGDSKDLLKLDDLVGNTEYSWNTNQSSLTLDGRNYRAFSNTELGLDLFVESEMRVDMS
jgi:Bacterial Ig-like domain